MTFRVRSFVVLCLSLLTVFASPTVQAEEKKSETKKAEPRWTPLFDGKSLKGWEITQFGGPGEVKVDKKNKTLIIEMGAPLNGITIKDKAFKKLPKINYEIQLKAQRALGGDFFVGLTFPVKDEHCSLIMGGWGGGVVGISSLNGYDAAENESTTYAEFENKKWYDIRLRVTEKKLQAWLNDEMMVDLNTPDFEYTTRIEVDLSIPLGLATFQSTSKIRDFKIRELSEAELETSEDAK